MTTPLTLTTGRHPDGSLVLTAVGEIDMSNVDALTGALTEAVTRTGDEPLVVDLTAVEYLDSAGLAALYAHVERIRLVANPILAPVLTISGLAELTTVEGP
ncbi:STAS domain-containing protein [Micromonospora sp. NPDC049559]|uniref:STAS domain-containing protein n=1 Tax=Micromonospora sp. NPDC049559 TaxID=3155923 RepID=UPI0034440B45